MDALEKVVLIKSAKYDYAEVDLGGNTLFIGANGSGKTTLLRAILYFYTADARVLGINPYKKISFSDYYFEYEESYIVYMYKKNEKYVLVVVYKDVSIKYRFCMMDEVPNIKELFIENTHPVPQSKLWQKLKERGTLSGVIGSGREYKKILYNKNHKLSYLSLFEAKEYESFTKTLANIFINSKVETEAIKKAIVSSLGVDKTIDIEQIKRHLESFNLHYEDITLFEKNIQKIKNISKKISEYEQLKDYMQDVFSSLSYSKEIEKQKLIKEKEIINKNQKVKKVMEEKLSNERRLFDKRKERIIAASGVVKEKIRRVVELKERYEKEAIDKKIESYSSLNQLEERLKLLKVQKEFLTKEHQELSMYHKNQLQLIENSFQAQKNTISQEQIKIEQNKNSIIQSIKDNESDELQQINSNFTQKEMKLKENQNNIILDINHHQYNKKDFINQRYIFAQEQQLCDFLKNKDTLSRSIEKQQTKLTSLDKELELKNIIFAQQIKEVQSLLKQKISHITTQIEGVEALIAPNPNQLSHKIYKNIPNSDKYFHFLKDEILRSDIDILFKEDSKQIFAIDFLDYKIQTNSLEKRLNKLKNIKTELHKNEEYEIKQIQKEQKSFESKIYKSKKEIVSTIKNSEISLATLGSKISTLKDQKEKGSLDFQKSKEENLQKTQDKIVALEKQKELIIIELKKSIEHKQNEIKAKKAYYTKLKHKENSEFDTQLEKVKNRLTELTKEQKSAKEEQEKSYEAILKSKNVDTTKLQELNGKMVILTQEIKEISSFNKIIIEYEKDKKEYLNKETEFKSDLKKYNIEFDTLKNEFNQKIDILEKELFHTNSELQKQKMQEVLREKTIKQVDVFEKGAKFTKFINLNLEYKPNDQFYDPLELMDRLSNLETQYEQVDETIKERVSKMNHLFNTSLYIKLDTNPIISAYNLKEYLEENKIEQAKEFLVRNLNQIVKSIVEEYDKLLNFQGQVEPLIKRISRLFENIDIGVIELIALRYSSSNNKIIESFEAIKRENDTNAFGYGANLFSQSDNSKEIIKLLKNLVDIIEVEAIETIDFQESFVLEFRIIENGNDSKFVQSLDNIGSNGTDVLVKSMIYIAMLYILKEKTTKKELFLHVILDEIGILSQRYLKELIEFANAKGIFFINGAPDEKLIGTYKRVVLITNTNNKSMAQEIILK